MTTATETLISPELMMRYGKLIYDVTGIRISPQKQALLANRVRRRLKATNIADFEGYLRHLQKLKPANAEWDLFLQEITTHETYLFRDESHWTWFQDQYLAAISQEAIAGKRPRSLRIWSAACSTGDEAYSAAVCVAACVKQMSPWTIKIIGTDIGIGAVEQARQATFSQRAMKLVPPSLRTRYFTAAEEPEFSKAKPELSALVQFRQHNLLDPLREQPFDLIFLKNVLIYFDEASKQRVVANVLKLLAPGGYLVAGAAEGISDHLKNLKRIHAWLYRNE
ncbi:Chemotaxis protein methyltransferase [Anatilimnocola aggregata]|uniref:protein-glutamate O-methyltransferase n=1 Tax=Anatilimnocola aggregata TaxID=2528021 RepID=A0A517YK25_9BACT|nr:protein-glutamate O-methyltransferase CheR [Anatilimnocola aggregata]QDU30570.1 Chemotaxis protein methyltransferase [Anatilimnocola aggregata]